jgi:hypothetical protein
MSLWEMGFSRETPCPGKNGKDLNSAMAQKEYSCGQIVKETGEAASGSWLCNSKILAPC